MGTCEILTSDITRYHPKNTAVRSEEIILLFRRLRLFADAVRRFGVSLALDCAIALLGSAVLRAAILRAAVASSRLRNGLLFGCHFLPSLCCTYSLLRFDDFIRLSAGCPQKYRALCFSA